ncbi:MAG: DUF4912 domain-containing protein [Bacillota bacterium]
MTTLLAIAGIFALIVCTVYIMRRSSKKPARKPEVIPETREEYFLPHEYGEDKVVLLVKDPYWLYAYWDISPHSWEEMNRNYGQSVGVVSRPLLRLYEVSSEIGATCELFQDIWLSDVATNWYINVGKPNCSFYVDMGRMLPDGTFIVFARSNVVTTPRDRMSDIIDPNWPPIDEVLGLSLGKGHGGNVGQVPGSPFMNKVPGSSFMENNRKG